MTFPDKKYISIDNFCNDYIAELARANNSIDRVKLQAAAKLIQECFSRGNWIYVCGNGGSAAIANHLLCDYAKCIQTDTDLRPKVISLSSNLEMITAIANDIEYDQCFSYQLATSGKPEDILMTISASGDSENIVNAVKWASKNSMHTISLTGFKGGRSAGIADINLHVSGENYGVIEDTHQSIMHIISQYLRQLNMEEKLISNRNF